MTLEASGKAGGFLARNWNTGTATDELSRKPLAIKMSPFQSLRSFDMHEELRF